MNIIVTGVAKSGTSIVAAMLKELGWNFAADANWGGESHYIEKINRDLVSDPPHMNLSALAHAVVVNKFMGNLKPPWIIKSPWFCYTLGALAPYLEVDFLLIRVRKGSLLLEQSWLNLLGQKTFRDGNNLVWTSTGHHLADWVAADSETFAHHGGPKLNINYFDLHRAVEMFDVERIYNKERDLSP